ncbi:MAG TPA: NAD-dependent epimerase/dehydratase family protein [Spongiibacteraceae bacterium]|jgi:nucleoside-diphosphate-sugar epimerase
MHQLDNKIILPGGAGLVGQNLVARLKQRGYRNLTVLDKNAANLKILQQQHPDVVAIAADLAVAGEWQHYFAGAEVIVMLQAQIGSLDCSEFERNNITATDHILQVARQYNIPYIVHISSSVLDSVADDDYTGSKREQERRVLASGIECVILRPTLMFGWFDRKHLGWLSRFMQRIPIFPIPGHGRYMRQPLYVGDFCNVIIGCIEQRIGGGQLFRISGLEHIDYIDIIREIKKAVSARCIIVKIPHRLFAALLRIWAWFDKNPPFTASQLEALTAGDEFTVIDWPHIFSVRPTPFAEAIAETFNHPVYSNVVLEF